MRTSELLNAGADIIEEKVRQLRALLGGAS
jgi:hypothetical protein